MEKFNITFCRCGRIHVAEHGYDWLAKDWKNRSLVNVCTNCGATTSTTLSPYEEESFTVNCVDLRDESFEGLVRIRVSSGIRVYNLSGKLINERRDRFFVNHKQMLEVEETGEFMPLHEADKLRKPWITVDTERLIADVQREYKDDADAILRTISGYSVPIHWENTPYEKSYNK